jgi:predicted LPLAT superfamily acyltransferase
VGASGPGQLQRPARTPAAWRTRSERGSAFLLTIMRILSLQLGRRTARVALYGIAGYFFLFAPTVRRHARAYLRRALGRAPTAGDRFRHLLYFATTIHDRVYLGSDRAHFEVSVEGEAMVAAARATHSGAFLIGAHFGSFEAVRAIGEHQGRVDVVMAMYEENARKINASLAAVSPHATPDVIPLGTLDALLQLRSRLEQGAFVGVLADRTLYDEPAVRVPFLGDPASFPLGPFRVAAMLGRRVLFMAGLYRGGRRYHVVFEELADFAGVEPHARDAAARSALGRYVDLLERHCRSDPYNWFNFFDFWHEPGTAMPGRHGP